MPTNTKEIGFEKYIEEQLCSLHEYEIRKPADYDKQLCVDRETCLRFIKTTQADEWKKLEEHHGSIANQL
jgi:type I restriction enzyme R subunit